MGSNPTLSAISHHWLDCRVCARHKRDVRADRIVLGLGILAIAMWFVVLLIGPFVLAIVLR